MHLSRIIVFRLFRIRFFWTYQKLFLTKRKLVHLKGQMLILIPSTFDFPDALPKNYSRTPHILATNVTR